MTEPVGDPTHPVQRWLRDGMHMLHDDLARAASASAASEPLTMVTAAVRAVGLDKALPELMPALEKSLAEMEPLPGMFAGPYASEVRMLALTGALRAAAEAHRLIPPLAIEAEGRAAMDGWADVLRALNLAAGAGFRRRASERLRGLYVIVDPTLTRDRDPLWVAEQALLGGASAIQLRDKSRDKGDVLMLATQLAELCRAQDATFLVNDHVDLAVVVGADGVHVGQHDLPLAQAKAAARPWMLVGTSNALLDEAVASRDGGADYIAVGRMFPTSSKDNTRPAGPETLRRIREIMPPDGPPLVAIGGITPDNVAEVARAGADGVCVIGAVSQANDPRQAAGAVLEAFRTARDRR